MSGLVVMHSPHLLRLICFASFASAFWSVCWCPQNARTDEYCQQFYSTCLLRRKGNRGPIVCCGQQSIIRLCSHFFDSIPSCIFRFEARGSLFFFAPIPLFQKMQFCSAGAGPASQRRPLCSVSARWPLRSLSAVGYMIFPWKKSSEPSAFYDFCTQIPILQTLTALQSCWILPSRRQTEWQPLVSNTSKRFQFHVTFQKHIAFVRTDILSGNCKISLHQASPSKVPELQGFLVLP